MVVKSKEGRALVQPTSVRVRSALPRVNITYFNPHFCISEMPTIFMGNPYTLLISQTTLRSFGSAFFFALSLHLVNRLDQPNIL
jgi:hypothetical protein